MAMQCFYISFVLSNLKDMVCLFIVHVKLSVKAVSSRERSSLAELNRQEVFTQANTMR